MPGFALRKNMVFDWNGTTFRIERLLPDDGVLLERIADGNVQLSTREELLAEFASGRISTVRPTLAQLAMAAPSYSRPIKAMLPMVQREAQRRFNYVKGVLTCENFVFTEKFSTPFIARIAAEIGDGKPPSATTLYRWIRQYRAHQDARALVPRTDRRGSRNLQQSERVLELASEATEEAFRASPLAKIPNIYVRLIAKIDAENRRRLPGDELQRPSLRTVYRMMDRIEAYDRIVQREGKAAADRRLRINRQGVEVSNILERVEIDHTPTDVFLIDDRTWLPLGRPTLTLVLDAYSRMILGYYLSFGGPSAAAVMGALRHAILPKTLANEVIQNLKIEHPWPCYGRPDVLVVDNGLEFHGNDLECVAFDLDFRIQYCPKHQPRFKGMVERCIKTYNYSFAHQLPGTSFARLHLRGDYDPQKHALLTLAEFRHIFEKWVVDVYAQEIHRSLGTTPWAKWQEGSARREPELPADLRQLQQRIGLVRERSLRRDGIWLSKIRYSGEALQPILSAFGEGVRVRILYDPEDLGTIQVWGPNDDSPTTVLAVNQDYAAGLTATQHAMVLAQMREQGAAAEDKESLQRAKQQLATSIEDLMKSRKQRHRRQAAALRGLSSSKADHPQFGDQPAPVQPPTSPIQSPDDLPEDLPVTRYASFRLKR